VFAHDATHAGNAQSYHQENAPVAELNTRSFPFSVITPLLRTHFHLFLVCETCAAPRETVFNGDSSHGARLLEL
jgi:alpha-glucosidase (family GH31 glycosyl hydrolase)